MSTIPVPDDAVRLARDATQALIEASKIVLHDLRHNQRDLETMLDSLAPLREQP